jgi:hypothetical protein
MKPQTPAQRITNPVWLREQIQELIRDCESNIKEDEDLADQVLTNAAERDKYLARVESHRYWRRQLRRILRGKTFADGVDEALQNEAAP